MDHQLTPAWAVLLIVLVAWELVWKGLALWRSARNDQPAWFIVLLIVNSVGILPIIYLLTHRRPLAPATPTP